MHRSHAPPHHLQLSCTRSARLHPRRGAAGDEAQGAECIPRAILSEAKRGFQPQVTQQVALVVPLPLKGPSQAPSDPQDGKEDATAHSGVELRRASAVQGATLGR